MKKSFLFNHYQITLRWADGFFVQICDTETKEIWESGPHQSATETVKQADKGLLWYFEAYDSRDSEERQTVRKEISLLLDQLELIK